MRRSGVDTSGSGAEIDHPVRPRTAPPDQTRNNLKVAKPSAFRSDQPPDTYSVGWNFNADFGGAGFASEAARALFEHLFSVKRARRLYAYVEEDNIASQRLCEKLAMRREGLFREFVSFVTDDEGVPIFENTMQYAILRKEWAT